MIEKKAEELVQLHDQFNSNAYMDSPYQRDPRFVIPSMYHEYRLRRRAHEERINKARSWIAQNLTSNEIERLNIFIKKMSGSSWFCYTAPPKEVVRVDVRHRETNYLPASPASVPAPASGSLSYGGFYPDQNDDDDEPSFASRRSTTDFLLTTATVTPDVATSAEEKPEAAPAANQKPRRQPRARHSTTARSRTRRITRSDTNALLLMVTIESYCRASSRTRVSGKLTASAACSSTHPRTTLTTRSSPSITKKTSQTSRYYYTSTTLDLITTMPSLSATIRTTTDWFYFWWTLPTRAPRESEVWGSAKV